MLRSPSADVPPPQTGRRHQVQAPIVEGVQSAPAPERQPAGKVDHPTAQVGVVRGDDDLDLITRPVWGSYLLHIGELTDRHDPASLGYGASRAATP